MKAIWNNTILAESDHTVIIENNHYFPKESLNMAFFEDSTTQTVCPWKGTASYYTLRVNGQSNPDAAWYYPQTSQPAKAIEGRVAFWKGVQIEP